MIGIYIIKNNVNNKCYIGKSIDIEHRFKKHLSELRKNNHFNKHLQNAYNKYGEANFEFNLLQECEINKLDEQEIYWIDYYKKHYNCELYNVTAGGEGGRMPDFIIEASKIKISKANKGKNYTKHFGKDNGMYGKKHTEESKKLMSQNRSGISAWNKGKSWSSEVKSKISQSLKNLDKSEIFTPEVRKKMSEAAKKRAQDPRLYKILCENMKKAKHKYKYSKEFIVQLQLEHNNGASIRSLSKKYKLPYESTRQLIIRNIDK